MGSLRKFALAGAAIIVSIPAASAADLPPIIQRAPPVPVEEYGGWYLRGDIGISSEQLRTFREDGLNPAPDSVQNASSGFDGAGIFRVGIGYAFNSWLRADVTAEWRSPANFRSFDIVSSGGTLIPEHVTVSKSEWVFLGNVYADLGTWWCLTPFVGAGAGFAANKLSNFSETAIASANPFVGTNIINANNFASDATTWNFAWALHAGLAYKATPGLTVELAYRYLNLGNAQSGPIMGFLNNPQGTIFRINDMTSHDVTLGVRWMLQPEQPAPMYPLVRKG
ncbi:MAG TPA: outer membrane beta-barrel protein [Xanthobacteraceae bacterium]|nr:outer membrane beta-barrel protein [Xanthobacteraceae bacterium]